MRLVNTVIGALSVLAFFLAVRAGGSEQPLARTLQYAFLPILIPYHFLVYADSISLLANLATLALVLRSGFAAAGAVGSLAILVRQTNVLWLVLVCVVAALDDEEWRPARSPLRAYLGRVWPALLGLAGFALFVLWNGGVAVGGRGAFAAAPRTGNVFLFLALYFVLFLPLNLATVRRRQERLADPALALLLIAAYVAFLATFRVDHPFNRFEGYLRNEMLSVVASSVFAQGAFFALAAGGIVSLYLAPLRRYSLYALYPLVLLSLLPLRLIEHRYGLAGLVLLLAARREESPFAEAAQVAFSMLLSAVVLYGLTQGRFML
jgi:alpha-1,2-glucosyltransferase